MFDVYLVVISLAILGLECIEVRAHYAKDSGGALRERRPTAARHRSLAPSAGTPPCCPRAPRGTARRVGG